MELLKKPKAAWVVTGLMIVAAIVIGLVKSPDMPSRDAEIRALLAGEGTGDFCVYDDLDLFYPETEEALSRRNEALYEEYGVVIAVVGTMEGGDVYDTALRWSKRIGLEDRDFIVVIDLKSMQYVLVQGLALVETFPAELCDEYANTYMLDHLNYGDFDNAVLDLTAALEQWYGENAG